MCARKRRAAGRQRELAHRLVHRHWERAVHVEAFGGISNEEDLYNSFDLTEPGNVVRALSYVEAALQHIGTSIERLHWWAFHEDPFAEAYGPLCVRLDWDATVGVRDGVGRRARAGG